MLKNQSIMGLSDNSGLSFIKIFHIYGGFFNKTGKAGSYVKGNVRMFKRSYRSNPRRKIKKGFVGRFFIKSQKYQLSRIDSSRIILHFNSCVLLKKKRVFYSRHLTGPTFRNINNLRIIKSFKNYL